MPIDREALQGALILIVLLSAAVLPAGEFNQQLNIGDAAPAWRDLPGTDGQRHSLADLADKEFVVVVFTCNSCPVARDYEDRIVALANKYGAADGRAAVVAINVNTIPDDRLDKMRERATEKKFPYPYLFDETQQIARDYGATFTPEFFVLDRQRKVRYMGRMDDSSNTQLVKTNELTAALDALLAGQDPPTTETLGIGCRIRYERQRRSSAR